MEGRPLVILLSCLLSTLLCADIGAQTDCSVYSDSCDSCIAADRSCAWCRATIFGDPQMPSLSRCFTNDSTSVDICPLSEREHPQASFSVTRNDNVQIRPQELAIQLRAGDTRTFDFTFTPGSNFPLDVYFLMDFGQDMADDFVNFNNNLQSILDAIDTASSNNQVAFGTFVDKPTETFVGSLREPGSGCVGTISCYYPHSFIHQIDFTNRANFQSNFTDRFSPGITTSKKANPFNSGLDAVVQVAECLDDINWRDASTQARRVLIYMSDSAFHLSSDAWIGGQARPHDGKCHLAPNPAVAGFPFFQRGVPSDYYPALQQEYASPALVQNKLEQARIVPAFLVTAAQTTVYQNLVEALSQNNAALLELSDDSSNLVTRLEELFMTLQANIRLSPEVVEGLEVEVVASCGTTESPNACSGVNQGQVYTFNVTVTLVSCNEELRNGVLLPISDPFLGTALLNITGLCDCDCSTVSDGASQCSSNGSLRCGICDCDAGFFGPICSCTEPPNCPEINDRQCSGRGICDECGICNCTNDFYGTSCECSDNSCGSDENGVCSGNGQCVCGVCQCNLDYTMRDGSSLCDCPMNETTCLEPTTMNLCSGRGECVCGECECEPGHGGAQCQFCLTTESCGTDNCLLYSSCLNCLYSISADNALVTQPIDQCTEECDLRVTEVSGENEAADGGTSVFQCSTSLGSCELQYFIQATNQPDTISVTNTPQNCAAVFPPWAYALIIFFALVIIGAIFLALLKLILYLLDVMEYKKFRKDVAKTQFGETENPIYRAPETRHPNPLFQGSSKAKEMEATSMPQTAGEYATKL